MDIFAIKLCLTPLSMLGVSLIARRWGSLVGGLIAGLPLTSGPISIYRAIEQGPAFAAKAAEGGVAGTSATLIAYACYVALTRRLGIAWSCILSLLAFVVPAFIMLALDQLAVAVAISLVAIACTLVLTEGIEASAVGKPAPLWDLPARLTASTAMVLGVTGFAARMGPALSGVLSPIPVIAWPLIVFAHVQGGRPEAITAVRGTAAGALGILVFYIVVARFVVGHNPVAVYAAALGGSIAICALAGALLQWHAARRLA